MLRRIALVTLPLFLTLPWLILYELTPAKDAAPASNAIETSIARPASEDRGETVLDAPEMKTNVASNEGGGFTLQTDLSGRIGLFSGNHFIGGETVDLDLQFSAPPQEISIKSEKETITLQGHPARLRYSVRWQLPPGDSTLTWQKERLRPPESFEIAATPWDTSHEPLSRIIEWDRTGDIRQIAKVQPHR